MATFTYSTTAYTLSLEVNEIGTSVANNTSTVSWVIKLSSKPGWDFYMHSFGWLVKFNNIVVADVARDPNNLQFDLPSNSTITIATGTAEVTHNADGTLNGMTAYAELDCAPLTYLPDGINVSGTLDLTPVSRSVVYIDNGSTFEAYQVYIDNGTSWELYIPYIDDGSNWVQYG